MAQAKSAITGKNNDHGRPLATQTRQPGIKAAVGGLGMRFIHTADWQLGKPFGGVSGDARAALQEARFAVIDRIAQTARSEGGSFVVVAGDVFDGVAPSDRDIRQALMRMGRAEDLRWFLLPGNHDYARADGLWTRLRAEAPENVTALVEPKPFAVSDDLVLLPAPLDYQRTTSDPSAWFDEAETPPGAYRIGLAHGSIVGFGGDDVGQTRVAIDRAKRARLDYLAMGDWHGVVAVDARTHYAGTPEPDDYRDTVSGCVLCVELSKTDAPKVKRVSVGAFTWIRESLTITSAEDFTTKLGEVKRGVDDLTKLVLRLKVAGALSLPDQLAVKRALFDELAHDVRWLDADVSELFAQPRPEDLVEIDTRGGVLRQAAEMLQAQAAIGGPEGKVASAALERLFLEHERARRAEGAAQ
jgi:DNA repair exonuclease SbcCD nuclease subunit